ncbi:unnamed protein product [Chrysoparadoxa australica]
MVESGVYRSSFPMKRNFPFLQRLGLRTVISLALEEYPDANMAFMDRLNIRVLQIGVEGNKEPFKHLPHAKVVEAVREIRDPANHPLLVHCNKGKHRTGCIIGCFRKTQGWALSSIMAEYIQFSSPKERLVDQRFIELFQFCAAPARAVSATSFAPASPSTRSGISASDVLLGKVRRYFAEEDDEEDDEEEAREVPKPIRKTPD